MEKKILMIDDKKNMDEYVNRIEKKGWQVELCQTADQARALIEEETAKPYDAISIDVNMPLGHHYKDQTENTHETGILLYRDLRQAYRERGWRTNFSLLTHVKEEEVRRHIRNICDTGKDVRILPKRQYTPVEFSKWLDRLSPSTQMPALRQETADVPPKSPQPFWEKDTDFRRIGLDRRLNSAAIQALIKKTADECVTQMVTALKERAWTGTIARYNGYLCFAVTDRDGKRLPCKTERDVPVYTLPRPGKWWVESWLQPDPPKPKKLGAHIDLREGAVRATVDFQLSLSSPDLRVADDLHGVTVSTDEPSTLTRFELRVPLRAAGPRETPDHGRVLYVQAFQGNRLIQNGKLLLKFATKS